MKLPIFSTKTKTESTNQKSILYAKENGQITNVEYQGINKISRQMATNELTELTNKFKLFKTQVTVRAVSMN